MVKNPMKSTGFEDCVSGGTGALENSGTVSCANRQHAWHGWHTAKSKIN
jgi:hypothetical protein